MVNMDDTAKQKPLARRMSQGSVLYYSLVLIIVFWLGVYVANVYIGQRITVTCDHGRSMETRIPYRVTVQGQHKKESTKKKKVMPKMARVQLSEKVKTVQEVKIAKVNKKAPNQNAKLILLYGPRVWTRYDVWGDDDWKKCPQPNCRITTNTNLMDKSSAVIFNAAGMPPFGLVSTFRTLKESSKLKDGMKFVFLSGLTPDKTYFNPKSYDDFFDLTMTYKSDSDIRIPFWPNDGILPKMLRPKSPGKILTDSERRQFQDENRFYFQREGKDGYMIYVIDNCNHKLYENIFAMRFRWEGDIAILTRHKCNATLMGFPSIESFPCEDKFTDYCSKYMEGYKFVMLPEKSICKEHLDRSYWYSLRAWEAVPILWASDDLEHQAIPGSYINVLDQQYVSPSFKEALSCKTNSREYSKYMIWKEEDRLDEFHWQCALCEKLHNKTDSKMKIDFSEFWNKEKNCGNQTTIYKAARDQLLRTGAITP